MPNFFTLLFISTWLAVSVNAQQIHFNNADSTELRRLSALEGTWMIAGEPKGNVPADTVITYCKWSPTGRYLICDQVVKSVKGNSTDLAIYTYDSPRKEYQFYTAGISGEKPSSALLQIESNTWIYAGEYISDGDTLKTRTLNIFNPSGNEVEYKSQYSKDKGLTWITLGAGKEVRIGK
jgi:hypothetical protein